MEKYTNSAINPRDEMDEVAQVISFLGRVIGAVSLDDYERVGAQIVAEWSAERLRNCSAAMGQAGSVPS
ncbi:hypothetical protein WP8S17C03_11720 [Metapseudomonas otitidis]|uniref:Uncharacterized protein n=1 Tax=Metapseudomonas otitidis TaxID=319939 RepID=A0A6S5RJD9_9GAMM|nr:hypothetical protein WP8S17C03_11720 [Pseudomonas otitidis]